MKTFTLRALILTGLTACATAGSESERAAKIRVTLNPEDVKGCQSLGVVNAPGGYEDPTQAIQHGAAKIQGADTAVLNHGVVPTIKTFRDTSGKPYTVSEIRGPIGEAYRCISR